LLTRTVSRAGNTVAVQRDRKHKQGLAVTHNMHAAATLPFRSNWQTGHCWFIGCHLRDPWSHLHQQMQTLADHVQRSHHIQHSLLAGCIALSPCAWNFHNLKSRGAIDAKDAFVNDVFVFRWLICTEVCQGAACPCAQMRQSLLGVLVSTAMNTKCCALYQACMHIAICPCARARALPLC